MTKPPTQPLPWKVHRQAGQSLLSPYNCQDDFVIHDADGFWVASFGSVRAEADFVVAVANAWHARHRDSRFAVGDRIEWTTIRGPKLRGRITRLEGERIYLQIERSRPARKPQSDVWFDPAEIEALKVHVIPEAPQ